MEINDDLYEQIQLLEKSDIIESLNDVGIKPETLIFYCIMTLVNQGRDIDDIRKVLLRLCKTFK